MKLLIGLLLGVVYSIAVFSFTDVYFHDVKITRVIDEEMPVFEFQSAVYLLDYPIKKFTIKTNFPKNVSINQGWRP